MCCPAESLVKTLFCQELFFYKCWQSEIEFQVSPTVQMPFLKNIFPSTSKYLLPQDTFTLIYLYLFIASSTSHADCYLSFKQTFIYHSSGPNMQSMFVDTLF